MLVTKYFELGNLLQMIISVSFGSFAATTFRRKGISFAGGLIIAILVWPFVSGHTLAAAKKPSYYFSIENGRIAGARRTIRFKQGDFVEILWKADSNVELHLHGYDLHLHLKPDLSRTMSFQAHTAGRYPVSTHGSGGHGALIYIEIHPK